MKAVIRDMYLCKNFTCAEIQEYLEKVHFFANRRQIKNRLSGWEFQRKKTPAEHYLAMLYLANFYAAQGYDVVFDVPKREEREDYTTRKIRKECDRIRKRRDRDRALPEPRNLEEAEKTLSDADIKLRKAPGSISPHRSRWPGSASSGPSPQDNTMGTMPDTTPASQCSPTELDRASDAVGAVAGLSHGFANDQSKLSPGISTCHHFSLRQHKSNVSKWVEPYYTQCFGVSATKGMFERQRRWAMQLLESILKQDNHYLFPTLAEVVMIFGSNQRTSELVQFLSDSCTVIDACPGLCGSFTYDAPFRYTLAFTENDPERMTRYGAQLKRSMAEIRQIWGEDHPNFLVIANFCAWHSIHSREYHLAIPLLRHCLPICERVVGSSSLVTINCLVIMSRAHAEIRNHLWARNCAELAISRLDDQRQELEQFRLVLLHRLGELNFRMGDYETTEMQFWKVLQDRAEVRGLDAGDTWSAAHSLSDLFTATGREDQAEDLMKYMRDRLDWARNCTWRADNHQNDQSAERPPQPPWWWPYGTQEDLN